MTLSQLCRMCGGLNWGLLCSEKKFGDMHEGDRKTNKRTYKIAVANTARCSNVKSYTD